MLTAVTFWILLRGVSITEVKTAVEGAKLRWLFSGFGLMLLYVALEGLCIKITMETMEERPSLVKCIRYAFVGFYFSGITPSASGGQPAQVLCMGRDRFSFSKSTLCLLLISSIYQLAMLIYGIGVYAAQRAFLSQAVIQVKWLLALGAGVNLLLVAAILFMMFSPGFTERIVLRLTAFIRSLGILPRIKGFARFLSKAGSWGRKEGGKATENPGNATAEAAWKTVLEIGKAVGNVEGCGKGKSLCACESAADAEKPASFEGKLRAFMAEYATGAHHIKKNPGLVMALFVITLARLTIFYMMPWFVALAFGVSGHTAFQMVGLQAMLTLAVSSLPFPGSVGISEGTSLLIFGMMFSSGLLLPAMLLLRGISFYAVLAASGMVFLSTSLRPFGRMQRNA